MLINPSIWDMTERDIRRPGLQHALLLLFLTLGGTLLGCLGDISARVGDVGSINVFWPASVLVAVGGIWFGGWGVLAGVLVGAFTGYLNPLLDGGRPDLARALLFVPSDFVQGFVPALIFRTQRLDPSLPTRREVGAFLLWGVLHNRVLGGVLAIASMRLTGEVAGFAQSLDAFFLWLLAGVWPGLLFGIPLLRGFSSVLPASSFFCKTWWGGSIRPRRALLKGEGLPLALKLLLGFACVSLIPLLGAGLADLLFGPPGESGVHGAILPVTLNLAFFLALVGVGRLSGTMNRRLETLEEGARALGAGDLGHRIPDLGGDEFGRLGLTFNAMAEDLARSREELARASAERARDLREQEIAAEIQRGFLPRENPQIPGYAFAASCVPARSVGGDFYGYIPLSGGRLGLLVGDVSGKGVPAALFTGLAKTLLEVFAQEGRGPAEAVGALNARLAADNPTGTFVTLVFAVLDPATGHLAYANAGHNPPVLVHLGGTMETLGATGLPAGMLPEARYGQEELQLAPGDTLALYSDGVTEAFGPGDALYGDDRLFGLLTHSAGRRPSETLGAVLADVEAHRSGQPPSDDTTLVLVRREPGARE